MTFATINHIRLLQKITEQDHAKGKERNIVAKKSFNFITSSCVNESAKQIGTLREEAKRKILIINAHNNLIQLRGNVSFTTQFTITISLCYARRVV